MVAHQQQGWDACPGKAHHTPTPFALEGGCRIAILIGIPGKQHQVNFFADGSIHNGIQ